MGLAMKLILALAGLGVLTGGVRLYVDRDFGRLDKLEVVHDLDRAEYLILRNGGPKPVRFHLRCIDGQDPNDSASALVNQVVVLPPGGRKQAMLVTQQERMRRPLIIAYKSCFVIGESLFGIRKQIWEYGWRYVSPPVKYYGYEAPWFRGNVIPVHPG
jgi:hypothetical protein